MNIILHEGRRPLNYFKNQIPNLHFYGKQFLTHHDSESFEEVVRLTNGVAENASIFVGLFGRLDPLAAKRRETKKKFSLRKSILGATAVFEKECADNAARSFYCFIKYSSTISIPALMQSPVLP